jgi:alpha-tubulin suppressor-like RCC1 family protein
MLRGVTGGLLVAVCMLALAVPAAAASADTFAWGEDEVGQLGDGATVNRDVPAPVGGLGTVTALAGGRRYSLALLGDGTVMAWGENSWGQLGDGTDTGPSSCYAAYASASGNTVGCSTTPVAVDGLTGIVAIATGAQHSLALLRDGTVMAWGDNEYGQLGIGTTYGPDHCYKPAEPTQCSTTPVPVSGLSEVTAIAAGQNDSFALLKDGTVMAWGSNADGDLGIGDSGTAVPTPITGLSGVTAIAAGEDNGLALLRNGTVMSWGANEFGQLGDGALTQSDVPVAVSGLSGVSAIAVGAQSLALREDGTVVAWGSNISGQLGIGTQTGPVECFPLNFCSPTPVEVSGIEHASAIAAGGGHCLALLSDGTVLAWGLGWDGQLGDGTTEISDAPAAVSGLEQVTTLAAGDDFSLAYGVPREPAPVIGQIGPGSGDTPTSEAPARTSSPSASQGVASLMARAKPPFPLLAAASQHKPLTRAQEFRRALSACKRKPKAKRGSCERRARKKYAPRP